MCLVQLNLVGGPKVGGRREKSALNTKGAVCNFSIEGA
jgi:hypothetical protein